MHGMRVFRSLAEAIREGYSVYDRFADGYVVRIKTSAGWAMALVALRDSSTLPQE